jgi:YgiT-type zinc finger domain-containing protein
MMHTTGWSERLAERRVTYTLDVDGQLFVIENVPARVNLETGEQLFAPDTVEQLQALVLQRRQPVRMMQVPVYEYA